MPFTWTKSLRYPKNFHLAGVSSFQDLTKKKTKPPFWIQILAADKKKTLTDADCADCELRLNTTVVDSCQLPSNAVNSFSSYFMNICFNFLQPRFYIFGTCPEIFQNAKAIQKEKPFHPLGQGAERVDIRRVQKRSANNTFLYWRYFLAVAINSKGCFQPSTLSIQYLLYLSIVSTCSKSWFKVSNPTAPPPAPLLFNRHQIRNFSPAKVYQLRAPEFLSVLFCPFCLLSLDEYQRRPPSFLSGFLFIFFLYADLLSDFLNLSLFFPFSSGYQGS